MTSKPYAEVIGDPIEQSLSPAIHNFWLEALGIGATYSRRRVARADLPAYLAERRTDENWRGANVTMPLKLDAVALADVSVGGSQPAFAHHQHIGCACRNGAIRCLVGQGHRVEF